MKFKIKLLFKMFYVLIPRIIRQQFLDDVLFLYKQVFLEIIKKIQKESSNYYGSEFKVLNLVNKIENLGCDYKLLFSEINRNNYIYSPKLYLEGKCYFKPEIGDKLPDINIYKFKKVSVVGSTDAIVFEDKFLHTELTLMEPRHDLKRWDIFRKINKNKYELSLNYNKKELNLKDGKTCITLLKEHSVNYYHFMTEGLPRLIQIVNSIENFDIKDYVLLIDDEMPKQCIEAIELILNDKINIIFVKKGEIIYCEELIYCTPLWTSLDNTTGLPNPKKEFFVDKYAIDLVRKNILPLCNLVDKNVNKSRKVYLQRLNNKLRPISNLNKLELLLLKYNYEFIDLSCFSLKEQVELFQNVDIVLGASGAAFTNLIFMKKGSKAVNFYPSVSATNYYIFQPLADISNVELIHFLTTPNENDISIHSEVSIDLNSLELLLKEI